MTHRPTHSRLVLSLLAAAFSAVAVPLLAQPAAPARPAAPEEETVKLSPFVISTDKDNGYIAADTLNAGRLRTNLLMTPGDMEVFTRDLLNDLGVFNIDEASGWLTNSRPLEANGINSNSQSPASLALSDSGGNVTLRGMSTSPSTRNYFLSGTTPMEYNVQRIEASRGPNAILYGEAGPGGGVNYMTKRAESRSFNTLRVRTDSLGSMGVSLDLNRPLGKKFDLRYNTSWLDQQYFLERVRMKSIGNALSAVYRPFERTTVNVDVDFTQTSRPGFMMSSIVDQTSLWNRVPVTGTLTTAQATAAGLALWSGTKYLVYIEGIGVVDMKGKAYSQGSGIPIMSAYNLGVPNVIRPPARSFNLNPRQVDVKGRTADVQASVDHLFRNGVSMQLAGQYAKYTADGGNYAFTAAYIDPNVYLPNGQVNPNFSKIFSTSYAGRSINGTQRDSRTVRLVAAYPIRGWGGTTSVSAFAHHQESNSRSVYWDLHIVDPASTLAITDNSSRINIYRYWDNMPRDLPDFTKMYDTRMVPTADGITKGKNDAAEIAASGSYLQDRLTYVVGFRRDKSALTTSNGDAASRDAKTGAFATYTTDSRVAYVNVKTVGVVYFPFRMLGFYADRAEGFTIQTNANPRLDGSFAKANIVPAQDDSYGVRFRLAQTDILTVTGSIGHYTASQENSALSIGVGAVNQLWANHSLANKYIETFSPSPTSTASLNSITSSRSFAGYGWEGSVTMNVANRFRLVVNGALPHTRQYNSAMDFKEYVAANTAQWTQWANDATNAKRTSDQNSLATVQQVVNGFQDERAQNGTYKYRYNLLGVYTVRSGALKGLRIGGGSQIYGPMIAGNQVDRPYDYIYASGYRLYTASLGYPVKVRKMRWDFQLNIDNLLDYDKPLYNGVTIYNGAMAPYTFRYATPRAFRLTGTYGF